MANAQDQGIRSAQVRSRYSAILMITSVCLARDSDQVAKRCAPSIRLVDDLAPGACVTLEQQRCASKRLLKLSISSSSRLRWPLKDSMDGFCQVLPARCSRSPAPRPPAASPLLGSPTLIGLHRPLEMPADPGTSAPTACNRSASRTSARSAPACVAPPSTEPTSSPVRAIVTLTTAGPTSGGRSPRSPTHSGSCAPETTPPILTRNSAQRECWQRRRPRVMSAGRSSLLRPRDASLPASRRLLLSRPALPLRTRLA